MREAGNSIAKMFAGVRARRRIAFMPYVCMGDGGEEFTEKLVRVLAKNGADLVELGLPFSDPIADGKTIQGASMRALEGGMNTDRALALVKRMRRGGEGIPFVVMTYYNLLVAKGVEKFVKDFAKAGVQGLIIPDLPLEESAGLERICAKYGMALVQLVAPSTDNARMKKIAKASRGFLYVVSVSGVTGARKNVRAGALALVRRAKRISPVPVAVGFGVSEPAHVAALRKAGADGFIVGSRLIDIYEKEKIEAKAIRKIGQFARKMTACR